MRERLKNERLWKINRIDPRARHPAMDKLRISWRKSAIGYSGDQKRTIQALGLRRLGHTVEHSDTPAIRGMIRKVQHLVQVAEVLHD